MMGCVGGSDEQMGLREIGKIRRIIAHEATAMNCELELVDMVGYDV